MCTKAQGHRASDEATLSSKAALLFSLCSQDRDHMTDNSALPADPQLGAARYACGDRGAPSFLCGLLFVSVSRQQKADSLPVSSFPPSP